jgi:hypothetical protein
MYMADAVLAYWDTTLNPPQAVVFDAFLSGPGQVSIDNHQDILSHTGDKYTDASGQLWFVYKF